MVGKEYYIFKRKIDWFVGGKKWAESKTEDIYEHTVFNHKSMILRPLKDVDMYLQENKRTNLRLAISKIDKTLLKPDETFSIWKLV